MFLPPNSQDEEGRQCSVCMYDCYLSAVTCACKNNKQIVCLRHSKRLCSCDARKKVLLIRYTLSELDAMLSRYDQKLGITTEQQLLQMQQAHALQEQEVLVLGVSELFHDQVTNRAYAFFRRDVSYSKKSFH